MKRSLLFKIQFAGFGILSLLFFLSAGAEARNSCYSLLAEAGPFNLREAVGSRGFLGVRPLPTAELETEMLKKGLSYWGVEVYVKPTLEAAREHDATENSKASQGIYLIHPHSLSKADALKSEDVFSRLIQSGAQMVYFEIDPQGGPRKMQVVPPNKMKTMFLSEGVIVRERHAEKGFHFWRTGWSFPEELFGVIRFSERFFKSKTAKEIERQMRRFEEAGGVFEFSQTQSEFDGDILIAAHTPRKNQIQETASRFLNPHERRAASEAFSRGEAFTIRVRLGEKVLGGILVIRHGNLFDFNTVFYSEENGIDYAKMASFVFFKRLQAQGVNELLIDMISQYSANTLKAETIDMLGYLKGQEELLKAGALPFDFKTPYRTKTDSNKPHQQ